MGVALVAVTKLEPTAAEVHFRLRMSCGRVIMRGNLPLERGAMAVYRSQKGFSLIELLIVVMIALIIAGFAVPSFLQTLRNFRINGDGVSINGEILTAKMRAAARFTHTRVYLDLANRQFRSQWWDKTLNSGPGGRTVET